VGVASCPPDFGVRTICGRTPIFDLDRNHPSANTPVRNAAAAGGEEVVPEMGHVPVSAAYPATLVREATRRIQRSR